MAQPYHICFTFHGDIRFDSRLFKCATTLASKGFQVSAIIIGTKAREERYSGVNVIRVAVPARSRALFQFLKFFLGGLLPAVRTQADGYFASDLYSLPLAYFASRIRRAKLLYDSRELYSAIAALRERKTAQRFWSYVEKKIISKAQAVFTVNEPLADLISARYGMARPVTLLNSPLKQEVSKSNRLRELLSIPSDQRVILYQGGLQRGRGAFVSLQVIRRIPEAVLVFLGQGVLVNGIRRVIEKRHLDQKVFVLDAVPVSELLSYTASAEIGLCLIENLGESYYYSLPNKLFEYIAAGVPVVASNFPVMREIVESNKVGLCVDPGNEEEILASIQRMIENPEFYRSLVANCKEAAKRFTWEDETGKLISAVEKVMNS